MSITVTGCLNSLASRCLTLLFFFFNDTATTEIYTLSLHDALPILRSEWEDELTRLGADARERGAGRSEEHTSESSHITISYAVFCLKKKKKKNIHKKIKKKKKKKKQNNIQ